MHIGRRRFLGVSAGVAGLGLTAGCGQPGQIPGSTREGQAGTGSAPPSGPFAALKPMTSGVVPISVDEREARIEKARRLMTEHRLDAVYVEAGTSLFYFTGIRWWASERMFAFVLPAKGEPFYVCPKFEEDRARELITVGTDVRTWEEDESPYLVVARGLRDRGVAAGRIGMEEQVRFFLYDGVRAEMPAARFVSADPVTVGCRVIKSEAEIALMQRAMDITIEAYRAVLPLFREGMTKEEFSALAASAHKALGVEGSISANFGESSALPHGSVKPRGLRQGDVVLMDGGCSVQGYRSDISRAVVFGQPTAKQREIWDLERRAQAAAFEAAKVGATCESVDAAARSVITSAGLGPDYKVPGLPHRTGHGIGLDGHEWTYLVRGNKTPIEPGMCFTNEPMIVLPGQFGIRIEDCMYITGQGARWFTTPSPSIDRPLA